MKKIKLDTAKLQLTKEKITDLTLNEMNKLKGGDDPPVGSGLTPCAPNNSNAGMVTCTCTATCNCTLNCGTGSGNTCATNCITIGPFCSITCF